MTTALELLAGRRPTARIAPDIDIVVPVYNEQDDLEASVRRLHAYLAASFPLDARITIADNASTDATPLIARRLAHELPGVRVVQLAKKGRGRALRQAWGVSDAAVLADMDVDLSTDLNTLLPLVAPLLSGHSDVARGLLSRVKDEAWFFDTELLVLAERDGLPIHEVPVGWIDDPDSRVDIVPTAIADLKGVARMSLRGRTAGQLARFAGIGVVSTLAYLALYAGLRTAMAAQLANAIALLVTAVANTAANRRMTFGVRGRPGALRQQLKGLGIFGVALAVTSGSLALLHAASARPARATEIAVLVSANLLATALRFVGLRRVFRSLP